MKTKLLKLNKDLPFTPRLCVSARVMVLILCILSIHVNMVLAQTGSLEVDGRLQGNGDMEIHGNGVFRGNLFFLGTSASAPYSPGLAYVFTDRFPQAQSGINTFYNPNWAVEWYFQHGGSSGPITSISLDAAHTLKLWNSNGSTPSIIMDPNGAGSISINGKRVLLEGANGGGNSIVTGDTSYSFGNGNIVAGYYSLASGYANNVQGNVSNALGSENITQGHAALASGQQNKSIGYTSTTLGLQNEANGLSSLAVGRYSIANGSFSTAIGYANTVDGQSSVALGQSNVITSQLSMAIGTGNTISASGGHIQGYGCKVSGKGAVVNGWYNEAQGWGQHIVGWRNIPSGHPSLPTLDDYVFIVGNGDPYDPTNDTKRSNAMTVKWNGDTTIYGNFDSTKTIKSNGKEVLVKGTKLTDVLVEAQGDIPMGQFTAGGQ